MNDRIVTGWVLTLVCADRVGIVAAVSEFLANRGGFITDSQQYADREADRFFMRVAFEATDERMTGTQALSDAFKPVADRFELFGLGRRRSGMPWRPREIDRRVARYRSRSVRTSRTIVARELPCQPATARRSPVCSCLRMAGAPTRST